MSRVYKGGGGRGGGGTCMKPAIREGDAFITGDGCVCYM